MKEVVFDTKINGDLTANVLIDYFLNACEPRVSPISDYCIASDNNQQSHSMYFSNVTDEEVCRIIKELKNKKSIGFDGIDVKIFQLKLFASICVSVWTNVFLKAFSRE